MLALKEHSGNALSLLQSKFPNYHPLIAMAEMAMSTNNEITHELRFQCHKELAKYVAPTLKSTEIRQTSNDLPTVNVRLFQESSIEDAEIIAGG